MGGAKLWKGWGENLKSQETPWGWGDKLITPDIWWFLSQSHSYRTEDGTGSLPVRRTTLRRFQEWAVPIVSESSLLTAPAGSLIHESPQINVLLPWLKAMRAMNRSYALIYGEAHTLAGGTVVKRYKRCGFDPWVRKIPRRKKWQPTPVFLPGKPHG